MTMESSEHLAGALQALEIPPEFINWDDEDPQLLTRLERWQEGARRAMELLQKRLEYHQSLRREQDPQQAGPSRLPQADLTPDEQTEIITALAPFEEDERWSGKGLQKKAHDILESSFPQPGRETLTRLLITKIKPAFQGSPHPQLNTSTGRKLPRQAGGAMAGQDFYEEQAWKADASAVALVGWCARHMDREAYEDLWHLIIPPIMTLLDDYQSAYKLRGNVVVRDMLARVPAGLLKRTGVAALLQTSLNKSLGVTEGTHAPAILREASAAILSLVALTTVEGSRERFDQLCALLGDGIIGTTWTYASREKDVMLASLQALPAVVDALGVGAARYLRVLVSQLSHVLEEDMPVKHQLASLEALDSVLRQCGPCVHRWRGTLLDGIARAWVRLMEKQVACGEKEKDALVTRLRGACASLDAVCAPASADFGRLLAADPAVFRGLLEHARRA
ncbi:uncharacterized protein SCHCODRAFT_02624635 [Schizophyllum commune H4-8]|uniref:uncharacterized protein n=1 Tax=Schizophyllum commune (strain H4-8 / FGSC 9210) TaxID=578458 RepID=UPI00215E9B30|nr:uncharacterized protein SCHCODRAFT_02624635 [Schizophyllum commune H4-8]KAI5894425.1 hypothetical protein SCHCODRAFT_02624635 [Schizophyllum commune H4-8]